MKIGVAFSGSGAGAASAHLFADALQGYALGVDMLSAASLAAVPALLWSRGHNVDEITRLMGLFSLEKTPRDGLRLLERLGAFVGEEICPFAVNSVDAATGISVLYADGIVSDAWNLKVYPLLGNERTALSSGISPYGGSAPLSTQGMQLCDFSVRYGCPFFPLKLAGMERLLSVCFAGGGTPAQIAADSMSTLTGKNADLHYTLRLDETGDLPEQIQVFVRDHMQEIYGKILF